MDHQDCGHSSHSAQAPAATGGAGKPACPVPIICPACHGEVIRNDDEISCTACGAQYPLINGIPDLIIGERFDDGQDEDCLCYEEDANADTTNNYWIPLFKRLWPQPAERPRLLSVGCGTGVDVDLLHEAGFDAIGIDCGNRTSVWPRRKQAASLFLANGKKLPFETGTFDAAFCGCVFPHVGVVGDSFTVSDRFRQDRLELAREMTRVIKPGGKVVVSSPNARFPFDLFHGRDDGALKPRVNWPGSHFLLSVEDYSAMFGEAGCDKGKPQPVEGYWGFIRSKNSLKGRLAGAPVRFLFWLVSRPAFSALRRSVLSPWIVVMAEKPGQ